MNHDARVPLSVLEVGLVPEGGSPGGTIRDALDLAVRVEKLGYRRFWLGEHHLHPGYAISAPQSLLALFADRTEHIRIGAGTRLLTTTSPLLMAEEFATLETLFPGRIDIALTRPRLPGGPALACDDDPKRRTHALVNAVAGASDTPPLKMYLSRLLSLFDGSGLESQEGVIELAPRSPIPSILVLGSVAQESIAAAAQLGLPYVGSHTLAGDGLADASAKYRNSFVALAPPIGCARSHMAVAVEVVVAATEEEARRRAAPHGLWLLSGEPPRGGQFKAPEIAELFEWSPQEHMVLGDRLKRLVIGDSQSVVDQLKTIVDRTGADELIVSTSVFSHAHRVESFELLIDRWHEDGPNRA